MWFTKNPLHEVAEKAFFTQINFYLHRMSIYENTPFFFIFTVHPREAEPTLVNNKNNNIWLHMTVNVSRYTYTVFHE
jgi:hypothetical protein